LGGGRGRCGFGRLAFFSLLLVFFFYLVEFLPLFYGLDVMWEEWWG
jgi:hypothetical protein